MLLDMPPDRITIIHGEGQYETYGSDVCGFDDVRLDLTIEDAELTARVTAGTTPLKWIRLYWRYDRNEPVRIMGDAWERGYGDLEWRGIVPERHMPWYMLISNGSDQNPVYTGRRTDAFGVKVQPSAICDWQYDGCGITLNLDIRCGGDGVILGGRMLEIATILSCTYTDCSAFTAGRQFCRAMCRTPRLPDKPVYGFNNWYYAYGRCDADEVIADAGLLAELTRENAVRPYMVMDDGWEFRRGDYPWDRSNEKFPDMRKMAEEISAFNVNPGLWVRPLIALNRETAGVPDAWRMTRDAVYLDPSLPEVIDYIQRVIMTIRGWGYKLIKHDFTTYDLFGKWGFQMSDKITEDGWHFADTGRTSAEIVKELYRAIRIAAGDAVVIGCNTIGHLSAGLFEVSRTGDDTSGLEWERTRKMGVNTLAFRMMQNQIFYACDADCVGITDKIPQGLNEQWMYTVGISGSPLFVSISPYAHTYGGSPAFMQTLKQALSYNAQHTDELIPLDWMETVCPREWLHNGKRFSVHWYDGTRTEI